MKMSPRNDRLQDGLPAEYYKTFEDILFDPYKKVIEWIEEKGELPTLWNEAMITLIHKEGTDKKEIKNYRSISLLNLDYKIYAMILAARF